MSAKRDTAAKTLIVAFILCAFCSVLVSVSAMLLKPAQVKNKDLDKKKNILTAAGLMEKGTDIESVYQSKIKEVLVDFETGKSVEGDVVNFDQNKASKIVETSIVIDPKDDIGKLGRRSKLAKIYLIQDAGQTQGVILPITSKGLWSTMYGFLALGTDGNTVKGLSYYQQGETPGLGAEVTNPKWMKQWPGKKVYEGNEVKVQLSKNIKEGSPESIHQVDALAGATITTQGVQNSLHYWLSENGYGTFLENFKKGNI